MYRVVSPHSAHAGGCLLFSSSLRYNNGFQCITPDPLQFNAYLLFQFADWYCLQPFASFYPGFNLSTKLFSQFRNSSVRFVWSTIHTVLPLMPFFFPSCSLSQLAEGALSLLSAIITNEGCALL